MLTLQLTTDDGQLTTDLTKLVRKGGLEPPHLSVPDPKSGASANSATFALITAHAALRS